MSIEEDYRALRTGVGLVDCATQALIEVTGADRAAFLHTLLTNDIKRLASGGGCLAALLTPSAKLVATLLVLADTEALWLLCDRPRLEPLMQALDRYHFSEQVGFTHHAGRHAVFALQGPRTFALLGSRLGTTGSLASPGDHVTAPLEGAPIRWVRQTLTGDLGALGICDAAEKERLWRVVSERGREDGLRRVGAEALDIARIEAGLPRFGVDMDEDTLLPETGLETVLASETKGCYIGQEIVARMQTYGSASKKLMGLVLDGAQGAEAHDAVFHDAEEVGRVTSACHSYALNRPIALGYVKRGWYAPGTAVEIARGGRRLKATVAARPLTGPANSG